LVSHPLSYFGKAFNSSCGIFIGCCIGKNRVPGHDVKAFGRFAGFELTLLDVKLIRQDGGGLWCNDCAFRYFIDV